MIQEQVGIPRCHEFHVLNEDADGVVRRLWRTLKALGLVDNSPVACRAALAEGPA